jgi:hypothetical protein
MSVSRNGYRLWTRWRLGQWDLFNGHRLFEVSYQEKEVAVVATKATLLVSPRLFRTAPPGRVLLPPGTHGVRFHRRRAGQTDGHPVSRALACLEEAPEGNEHPDRSR